MLKIDWDSVPKKFNWIAVDFDGEVLAFENKPYLMSSGVVWSAAEGEFKEMLHLRGVGDDYIFSAKAHASNSLTQRPACNNNHQTDEKQPHPHAELMLQYAQDCAIDKDAWKNWQIKERFQFDWVMINGHPTWSERLEYRRKPRTIVIGGMEVPTPETREPKNGTVYYQTNPQSEDLYSEFEWVRDRFDLTVLQTGMLHLSKENAIIHAKALIKISGGTTNV